MPGYANPPEISGSIVFTPSGNLSSTTVQDAITELESEKIFKEDADLVIFNQVFR